MHSRLYNITNTFSRKLQITLAEVLALMTYLILSLWIKADHLNDRGKRYKCIRS